MDRADAARTAQRRGGEGGDCAPAAAGNAWCAPWTVYPDVDSLGNYAFNGWFAPAEPAAPIGPIATRSAAYFMSGNQVRHASTTPLFPDANASYVWPQTNQPAAGDLFMGADDAYHSVDANGPMGSVTLARHGSKFGNGVSALLAARATAARQLGGGRDLCGRACRTGAATGLVAAHLKPELGRGAAAAGATVSLDYWKSGEGRWQSRKSEIRNTFEARNPMASGRQLKLKGTADSEGKVSSVGGGRPRRGLSKPVVLVGLLLGVFFLILSFVPLRQAVEIGADEGFGLAKATLCLKGYHLYRDVWCDHPPVHTFLLTQVLRHVSPSVAGPRLVSVGFAALLLGAVFVLVWRSGVRLPRNETPRFEPLNARGIGNAGFPTGEPADWKVGVTEDLFMGRDGGGSLRPAGSAVLLAAVATRMLMAAPAFLELSGSVLQEIPALALAVAGLAVFSVGAAVWMGARVYLQVAGIRHGPQLYSRLVLQEIARLKPFTKFFYTDEPVYSFHAGIPLPPRLGVISLKRFWSGDLSNEQLTAELQRVKPDLMLLATDTRELPFSDFLHAEYRLVYEDAAQRLYAHQAVLAQARQARAQRP